MYMQGLANFIDDFLGGLILIAFSLAIGSLFWAALILRAWSTDPQRGAIAQRGVALLRLGAWSLAIAQGTKLAIKAVVLASVLGELPIDAYTGTAQFQAGLAQGLLAAVLALLAGQLHRDVANRKLWNATAWVSLPLIVAGAWLVHGVGRFDDRGWLMTVTILHQLAAAIWVGGVAQLLALWYLTRLDEVAKSAWPRAVVRFGALGVGSVVLLLLTGLPLAWTYIGSWDGLFGTGYGCLVVTKALMLLIALGFAYQNHKAGRDWVRHGHSASILGRVPYYIEGETFILVGILFVAATLSSQPPAVDIPELTASVSEVADMFTPRIPSLTSPSHEELMAGEAGRVAVVGKVPSVAATEWSDYNHNVSGVILTSMGLIAMLSYLPQCRRWARFWPLGFIGLGLFLFFRSDAETWPLGPIGFWESTLRNGEVFQHRIATLVAFCIGIMEFRSRSDIAARWVSYIFPLLCAFGGILLLTHAHAEFELKSEYLIQSTHTVMGLLAVLMASGRWLELRLGGAAGQVALAIPPEGRIAGFIAILAMFAIGNILLVYKEPLF